MSFLRSRIEQVVKQRLRSRDPTVATWELVNLKGPHDIANPDPTLGDHQHRYYATFEDFRGIRYTMSVNYDEVNDQFGIIKRSSGA